MEGNPLMEFDELKTLLAIESKWMVSLNGLEFVPLDSSDISIEGSTIQLGPHQRFLSDRRWLRPDVIRLRTRPRFRARTDTITLYPGDRLPPADHRRRRRAFQTEIGQALCRYFGVRSIQRQMLYSDRQRGIGGAPPRFFIAGHAVIDTSAGSYETFGAHEEHRLESNVIGEIRRILPTIDVRHIYPQVPSFVGMSLICGPSPWMAG